MKTIKQRFLRFYHFTELILRRFFDDSCFPRASGLAYSTLMSAVPLLAVLIGFGGPFMAEEKVQSFLARTMLPAMQEQVMAAVVELAENGTRLGILGLPIFLVAVTILLNNIEMNLNHIFRVSMERRGLKWFTTHLAVVVFMGLFLGSSLSLTGDMLEQILGTLGYEGVLTIFENRIAPFLFIFIGQFIILTLIPGRRVKLNSALIAAFTGSVLWELSKSVFAIWATRTVRMSLIYGSFFILPLLLIWLVIIWIIILLMAEFTYVHQHRSFYEEYRKIKKTPGDNLVYSLRLYSLIIQAYKGSKTPPGVGDLADALNIPEKMVEDLLAPLIENNMLRKAILDRKNLGFVPAAPLEKQSVAAIIQVLTDLKSPYIDTETDPLLRPLYKELEEALEGRNVDDYLNADD
jgi:membrane protein